MLPTNGAGHADVLAREAVAEGADLVLVLGGDGTINEAVQGLVHSGVPLGILPGGTANVLAMELGLGSRLERAAERLGHCRPVPVSLGRVRRNGIERYFLLMCGLGLDAAIVCAVNPATKASFGKLAYYIAGFSRAYRTVDPLKVMVKDAVYPCGFALVSRVRNYGGDLEIASDASLRHEDFEVVLFEGENPLRYIWYMLGVATKRVRSMRGVRSLRARCVEVLTPAPAQVDGEFLGSEPISIDIVPQALCLLMPESYG